MQVRGKLLNAWQMLERTFSYQNAAQSILRNKESFIEHYRTRILINGKTCSKNDATKQRINCQSMIA